MTVSFAKKSKNHFPHSKGCIYIIGVLFLSLSCNGPKDYIDADAYYFPVDSLSQGRYYLYESTDDRFAPQYWFLRSFVSDTGTVLSIQILNQHLDVEVTAVEKIGSEGSTMQRLTLVHTDTLRNTYSVSATIVENAVFPFRVRDSLGVFIYSIRWKDPIIQRRAYELIRNRRFYGMTTCSYLNSVEKCMVFRVRELISTEEEGIQEIEYAGEEYYAKGVGLVGFRKEVSDDLLMEYRLTHQYSPQEFEDKYIHMLNR